jgi:hypothetical protein
MGTFIIVLHAKWNSEELEGTKENSTDFPFSFVLL